MSGPLRIGLVGDGESPAAELAHALRAAGHRPELVQPRPLPDGIARLRKIGVRPGRAVAILIALARGGYDIAHAFDAEAAAAAVVWSRLRGRPAVFTVSEPLSRANVAHRRLRLATLRRALDVDAVVAPDAEVSESVRRWMAVEARVADPRSADEHVALYRALCGSAADRV